MKPAISGNNGKPSEYTEEEHTHTRYDDMQIGQGRGNKFVIKTQCIYLSLYVKKDILKKYRLLM
jgi:hypothetical protein